MIDLHTHLLPAVDDGARTAARACAVLARFAADGVTRVACTPHLAASQVRRGQVPDLGPAFAALRAAWTAVGGAAAAGLTLLRGWEIRLDDPGVELAGAALGIGGGSLVLVELPRGEIPPGTERELERLRASGIHPLLAHPERYAGCTPEHVRRWRAAGALMQGDATTVCADGKRAALARALLAEGAYDVLASDNHGDVRALAVVRDYLVERGARDAALQLTQRNPALLLDGLPAEPVPPVAIAGGVAAQLRGWLLARLPGSASAPPVR